MVRSLTMGIVLLLSVGVSGARGQDADEVKRLKDKVELLEARLELAQRENEDHKKRIADLEKSAGKQGDNASHYGYVVAAGLAAAVALGLWVVLCWRHYRVWEEEEKKSSNPSGQAGASDAQLIREMIRHENDLTNHRLMWLVTLEGLLFTALGLSWGKSGSEYLIPVLSLLGIVAAGSAAIVLDAAHTAFLKLAGWWKTTRAPSYTGPDVCGFRGHHPLLGFLAPWRVVPLLFIVGWFLIVCITVVH